jgi:hypothetical protein
MACIGFLATNNRNGTVILTKFGAKSMALSRLRVLDVRAGPLRSRACAC